MLHAEEILSWPPEYKIIYIRTRMGLTRKFSDGDIAPLINNFYNFSRFSNDEEKEVISAFIDAVGAVIKNKNWIETSDDEDTSVYDTNKITTEIKRILVYVYVLAKMEHEPDENFQSVGYQTIESDSGTFRLSIADSVTYINLMIDFYILEETNSTEINNIRRDLCKLLIRSNKKTFNKVNSLLLKSIKNIYDPHNNIPQIKLHLNNNNYDINVSKDYIKALIIFVDF